VEVQGDLKILHLLMVHLVDLVGDALFLPLRE
jgi:hypothetical protein